MTFLGWLWTYCSWITHIYNINEIVNYKDNNCASSWLINKLIVFECNTLEKLLLSFYSCLHYSILDVLRKFIWHYDVVMEIFFYIFSTFVATMPIKYSKYLNLRPVLDTRLFSRRLNDIQNYCDSIFICFSNCSDVCIRCKTPNWTKSFCTYLRRLKLLKSCWFLLSGALHKFCDLLL